MKISVLSDLHFETGNNPLSVLPDIQPDVFVLAGDIHNGAKAEHFIRTLLLKAPVIYVAGNHEFYYHRFPETYSTISAMCDKINDSLDVKVYEDNRVFFLQDDAVEIDGHLFLGTTLWTDFGGNNPIVKNNALFGMRDYDLIKDADNKQVFPDVFYADFFRSSEWLKKALESYARHFTADKTVVVTHHAPSFRSVNEYFSDSELNACFASNLDSMISSYQPILWIHGHMHIACDYEMGSTRVVCNPHGYPNETVFRAQGFDKNLMVEI